MAENDAQGEWTLPDGWVWTTLGEIRVDESYSITPKKTPKQDFELYSVPSFAEGKPEIVKGEQIGSSKRVIQEKAVLLCKINPRINRVWVVGAHSPWPKVGSTEWIPFFQVDGIEPGYLCYFMQQDAFKDFLALHASGVGGSLMRIKPTTFADYPFPLAPLPEQRRIIAEIETQFTRLDAAVAALERAQANIRRYKAAVLQAACEGRLVPTEVELARAEGRDYEPADQLLVRILAERRARWEADYLEKQRAKGKELKDDKWKQEYKEPAPPDTEDLPELPEGWTYALIEPLLSTTRPGMKTGPFGSLLKKHEHRPKGVPVLGIENIGPTGYVPGNKIFITEEKADQLSKYDVQPNDILISRSGTVGEVCIVPEGLGRARFSTNLMRIVLEPNGMLPKFFRFLFDGSPFVLDQVSELCSGSTRDFLNQKILKSIVFPLSPLAEQRRIVAEVERRLSVVEALEAALEAALARAGRLRQAVLKQAFEGRLVPQGPNDEPASVLLERIRADETERKPKGKGSGKKRRKTEKTQQLELF